MSAQSEVRFPPRLLRASAGTGKTFQLTNRLIALLLAGEKPERVLATTFTKKAAAEIRERVFSRIAEASLDEQAAADLSEKIQAAPYSKSDYLNTLDLLAASQHKLSICTLDSFFVQIAKQFALELGLPFTWELLDESSEKEFNQATIRRAVESSGMRMTYLLRLFASRSHAKSIYQTFKDDLYNFVPLAKQSDFAAWNWLRPPRRLSPEVLRRNIEELESFENLPKTQKGTVNLNWSKAVATTVAHAKLGHWEELLKNGLPNAILSEKDSFSKLPISDEIHTLFAPLIQHARACLLLDLRHRTTASYCLFTLLERASRDIKSERGYFAFGDISRTLAERLEHIDTEQLYYRLDSQLHHLLLDEFQDTSVEQWQILSPFAEEILSKSGEEYSFFCVGDVKQAIYGWRGGEAALFDALEEQFFESSNPDRLDHSRRSSPVITEAVNKVFSSLGENEALAELQSAAEEWQRDFRAHTAENREASGHVEIRVFRAQEENETEEDVAAEYVFDVIRQLQKVNPEQSIGVLLRKNKLVAPFIQSLRKHGILASQEGGNSLSSFPVVSLFLSLLQLADHPSDSLARFRLRHSAFATPLGLLGEDQEQVFQDLSLSLRAELLKLGYGKTLLRLLNLVRESLSSQDYRIILQLVELAYVYQKKATLRASDFLTFVENTRVEDPSDSRVKVMTIHKSKGLEFDSVILPELSEALGSVSTDGYLVQRPDPLAPPQRVTSYPNKIHRFIEPELKQFHKETSLIKTKESLSMLYVALTRARYGLYMGVTTKKEKKRSSTFARLLLSAFEVSTEDPGVVFEAGSITCTALISPSEQTRDTSAKPRKDISLKPRPKLHTRSLQVLSPSSASHLGEAEEFELSRSSASALRRGSVLHKMYEEVEWLEEFDADRARLFQRLAQKGFTRSEVGELLPLFEESLSSSEIRPCFLRSNYSVSANTELDVFREMPFAYRDGNTIVRGSIDRLVLEREGQKILRAHIMDFKSDTGLSSSEELLAERVEQYSHQVTMYRLAAEKLFHLPSENIQAELLFIACNRRIALT